MLDKFVNVVKTNRDAIIQKGLVVLGVVAATVIIAAAYGLQQEQPDMIEAQFEPDAEDQPVAEV